MTKSKRKSIQIFTSHLYFRRITVERKINNYVKEKAAYLNTLTFLFLINFYVAIGNVQKNRDSTVQRAIYEKTGNDDSLDTRYAFNHLRLL